MSVKPTDIKYIKNVKHPDAFSLAYGDRLLGAKFKLDFSNQPNPTNLGLSVGDIVLLYQTVPGVGTLRLTHLVRILDTTVGTNPNNPAYPHFLNAEVVGRISDGIEKDLTAFADILDFGGIAMSGSLQQISSAIKPKTKSVPEVQDRLVELFKRMGAIEA